MSYYIKKDFKKLIPVFIICFIGLIIFLISMVISTIKENEFKNTLEEIIKKSSSVTYTEQGINVLDLKVDDIKYGKVIQKEKEFELLNVSDGNFCGNGKIDNFKITKGNCDKTVPSCNLIITDGTLGFKNWYTTIPFITMKTSASASSGLYYGIGYEENYQANKLDLDQIGIINFQIDKSGTKKLYGYVKNGVGVKATCEIDIKVDIEKPVIKDIVKNNNQVTFTINDNIGITSYLVTTSLEPKENEYSNIKTTKTKKVIYDLEENKKYYIYAVDEAGNINKVEIK